MCPLLRRREQVPGSVSSVSYSVIYSVDLSTVADLARVEIEKAFGQIAEAIAGIPEASPFFSSIDDSMMQIDVEGWRLVYRLDPVDRILKVIEASPLPVQR